MTKITNNARAAQGINTKTGLVFLKQNETRDLDVSDVEMEGLKSLPFLGIEGVERPQSKAPTLGELNAGVVLTDSDKVAFEAQGRTITDLQGQIEQLTETNQKLTADLASLEQLKNDNAALTAERDDLKARVTKFENDAAGVKTGVVARHKGGGSYSVFDAENTELMTGLTKEQADAVNALPDDAAKSQWIKENTKAE